MGRRAAKRYATALIHLAQEQKSMDQILEQTQTIKQSIKAKFRFEKCAQ